MKLTTETSPLVFYGGCIYLEIGIVVAIVICILMKKDGRITHRMAEGEKEAGPIMIWVSTVVMWPVVIYMLMWGHKS